MSDEDTNEELGRFKVFYLKLEEKNHSSTINIEKITKDKIETFKLNTGQEIKRSISQKSIFVFDNCNIDEKIENFEVKYNFDLKLEIIS
jgi:hypothetical protein